MYLPKSEKKIKSGLSYWRLPQSYKRINIPLYNINI